MADYKLPKLKDLSEESIKYVAAILEVFSADELNHLIMHGVPEECERCEKLAIQIPDHGGYMMDMINPIWTEVGQLAYELETDSEYKTVNDRKGQWEELIKDIDITIKPREFDWYLHGSKHESVELLMDQGLTKKEANKLAEMRFDYEIKLRFNTDGKLLGAGGYYLSDKKYK